MCASVVNLGRGALLVQLTRLLRCERCISTNITARSPVPGSLGKKIAKASSEAGAVSKKKFETETDTTRLVNYCCGVDYRVDDESVLIKPDSEYPDWLFTMDVSGVKPSMEQLSPDSIAYWRCVHELGHKLAQKLRKHRRL